MTYVPKLRRYKRRYNECLPEQILKPLSPLPPDHVIECPSDWLVDPDLKPIDICVMLTLLAYATDDLLVQISRRQVAWVLSSNPTTIKKSFKRLKAFRFIRKLPTANGFIPVFKINPLPKNRRKKIGRNRNRSEMTGRRAPTGGGSKISRGVGSAPGSDANSMVADQPLPACDYDSPNAD